MKNHFMLFLGALLLSVALSSCSTKTNSEATSPLRFEISYPESLDEGPLTGRMFLAFGENDERDPRLQVGRYGVQFFGIDFENLMPGETVCD
jgi:hypothetical protein